MSRDLDLGWLKDDFVESGQHLLGLFDMEEYVDSDQLDQSGHAKMGRVLQAMAIAYMKEVGCDDGEITMDAALEKIFASTAIAYKKFLVVKTVEAKAKGAGVTSFWTEKSMVSKVIECVQPPAMCRPPADCTSTRAATPRA